MLDPKVGRSGEGAQQSNVENLANRGRLRVQMSRVLSMGI